MQEYNIQNVLHDQKPVGYHSAGEFSTTRNDPSTKIPLLFTPLKIRDLELKNRIVVSPMCQYSSTDGFMNDWHMVHLSTFAKGGASLVIFEASAVSENGRISPFDAGIWKDDHIEPMKRIVSFIHSVNSKAGIQIAHAGRKASTVTPYLNQGRGVATVDNHGWTNIDGPSAIPFNADGLVPHELTIGEIEKVIQQFEDAAVRAEQAGFDVIEIHGAHGYLISSFLSGTSNKRTDRYGGDFNGRCRILLEIASRVRKVFPITKPVFVRISCNEWVDDEDGAWTVQDSIELAKKLKDINIDLLDCSSGGNNPHQKITVQPLYQVPFADAVRKAVPDFKTSAVGLIETAHEAESILQNGSADLVMLARPFLRDPFWPVRAANELNISIDYVLPYQLSQPRRIKISIP